MAAVDQPVRCLVCDGPLGDPVYDSANPVAVTSLCELRKAPTVVRFCPRCGHLQTEALPGLVGYYDQDYKILIDSEEEDQLYAVVNGRKIFRTEHQVETLLNKVALPSSARVLDYGCAKSSTLRQLLVRRPDVIPYVFDVSEMYRPFWEKFVPAANCATYESKPEWANHFDLVTSFFALEHVIEPCAALQTIVRLLKAGGIFYCIVPNVFANTADLVVADHVNHFSAPSLRCLLTNCGLEVLNVDDRVHASAWVVVARKPLSSGAYPASADELAGLSARVAEMAEYWRGFGERVRRFESEHHRVRMAAIYGSGFYGTFIASSLRETGKLACFIDQNPHRQKQKLLGKPILPPEALPGDIELIYVGLNPVHARAAIQSVTSWRRRRHTYFYP